MTRNPAFDEPPDAAALERLRRVKRKVTWKPPKHSIDRVDPAG
jgi:hypothetical protein